MGFFNHIYFLSISILLAAVAGAIKFFKIDATDRPIVVAWCFLVVNETLRTSLMQAGIFALTSYNIAVIILFLLYVRQFYSWRVISKPLWIALSVFLFVSWFLDYFVLAGYKLPQWRTNFRIIASASIVILSVLAINGFIVSGRSKLWGNHRFVICIGFLIYYTYRVFIDAFYLIGSSIPFYDRISSINLYLLQVYYFLMFIAALWIPRKKDFILPLS